MTENKNNKKKLNHIAIAVSDVVQASKIWRDNLGCIISEVHELPEHGVKVIFVEFSNIKIELLEPIDKNSPISNFLEKNTKGGIHHICCEVKDISKVKKNFAKNNIRILGDGSPKTGAHGNPVIFLNPTDTNGTLIELEEVK